MSERPEYNGATDTHCPYGFHHVWMRDPWPLPQREYCQHCGRGRPKE